MTAACFSCYRKRGKCLPEMRDCLDFPVWTPGGGEWRGGKVLTSWSDQNWEDKTSDVLEMKEKVKIWNPIRWGSYEEICLWGWGCRTSLLSSIAGHHAWFSSVPYILYFVGPRTRLIQSPYLDWVPWTMDTAVQHWQSEWQNDLEDLSSSLSHASSDFS